MSKYTTELRYICENYAGYTDSQDYGKLADVLQKSRPKVFDFDYPIFDPKYKSVLETKILKHFYMREIGFETVAQFKLFLDMKMNEIMPLYNQYYKSELIKFDPMTDFDYHVEGNKKGTGNKDTTFGSSKTRELQTGDTRELITAGKRDVDTTGKRDKTTQDKSVTDSDGTTKLTTEDSGTEQSTSDTNTTGTKWDYYHDTPQGSIATLNDHSYLTNARKLTDNTDVGYQGNGSTHNSGTQNGTSTNDTTVTDNGSENESSSGTENETRSGNENESRNGRENESERNDSSENMEFSNLDDYAEHHWGKSAGVSYSEFLKQFRSTFMNIDIMVIGELEELFMGLW